MSKIKTEGKSYFSITTKEVVEKHLSFRKCAVELEHIIKGRHATIATHLKHFLSFIGKDTKLKELERTVSLKKVEELCKEFGFTAGMLNGALVEGRKKK